MGYTAVLKHKTSLSTQLKVNTKTILRQPARVNDSLDNVGRYTYSAKEVSSYEVN